jgi:hypothetical protein
LGATWSETTTPSRSSNEPDTIRQCLLLGQDGRAFAAWGPLALDDVELDGLAFFQRTVALDGACPPSGAGGKGQARLCSQM